MQPEELLPEEMPDSPDEPPEIPQSSWLGSMRGTGQILGDIEAPAVDESDWEALQ